MNAEGLLVKRPPARLVSLRPEARGRGGGVSGARCHGASGEGSDPSPAPSASVINPANANMTL